MVSSYETWKRKCDMNDKGGRAMSQGRYAGQDGIRQSWLSDQSTQKLWRSMRETRGVRNRGEILTFSVLICENGFTACLFVDVLLEDDDWGSSTGG